MQTVQEIPGFRRPVSRSLIQQPKSFQRHRQDNGRRQKERQQHPADRRTESAPAAIPPPVDEDPAHRHRRQTDRHDRFEHHRHSGASQSEAGSRSPASALQQPFQGQEQRRRQSNIRHQVEHAMQGQHDTTQHVREAGDRRHRAGNAPPPDQPAKGDPAQQEVAEDEQVHGRQRIQGRPDPGRRIPEQIIGIAADVLPEIVLRVPEWDPALFQLGRRAGPQRIVKVEQVPLVQRLPLPEHRRPADGRQHRNRARQQSQTESRAHGDEPP